MIVYQLLRTAIVDAVESAAGIDPDRASFTVALEIAREQVILTGTAGPTEAELQMVGRIGTAVLDALLPARRPRTSARQVKAGRTRYPTRPAAEPRPRQSRRITALSVSLRAAPAAPPQPSAAGREDQRKAAIGMRPMGAGNRNRVFHLMAADPERAWRPKEVTIALGIHTAASFATQMSQWAAEVLLKKIAYGTYTLADAWKPNLTDPDDA